MQSDTFLLFLNLGTFIHFSFIPTPFSLRTNHIIIIRFTYYVTTFIWFFALKTGFWLQKFTFESIEQRNYIIASY